MFRILGFIRAKDGMSQEDFRSYYENQHVPLIRRLIPVLREYKRNYLDFSDPDTSRIGDEMGFNVVTEASFDSEEDYDLFRKLYQTNLVEIKADEAKFVKRNWRVIVEQYS